MTDSLEILTAHMRLRGWNRSQNSIFVSGIDIKDLRVWSELASISPLYAATSRRTGEFFSSGLPEILKRKLENLGPNAVVADLGCGYGRLIPEAHRVSGGLVLGVDGSRSMLLAGSGLMDTSNYRSDSKMNVRLIHADLSDVPIPNNLCDVVYSSAVLLHNTTGESMKIISEAHRILKPGGFFILLDSFPYRYTFSGLLNFLYSSLPSKREANGPVRSFSIHSVNDLLWQFSEIELTPKSTRNLMPSFPGILNGAARSANRWASRAIQPNSFLFTTHIDAVAKKSR